MLGDALKKHTSVGELVMGWGIAMVALMVNTVAVCALLYVSSPLVNIQGFPLFRFLRQRLLPESPGRDQRAAESRAYARWFQRCILPSPVGNKARTVGNTWLRGCVSDISP